MKQRAVLFALILSLLLAPRAGATWSIILVDTATGEIAVGAATCLGNTNLQQLLPVVVVGKGAACAQSSIDTGAVNRKKIWDAFQECVASPAEIIEIAKQGDLFKASRQYGVIDLSPDSAGFTGPSVFGYKEDRQGSAGTLAYTIQGNVLSGPSVIDWAEDAVVNTPGTLLDKLMAGMAAAHSAGGDGRCSCDVNAPQSCGDPPAGFDPLTDKSAHVAFMVLARPGDPDGNCTAAGCATGDYYFSVNIGGSPQSPEPIGQLQAAYDQFQLDIAGHPDGLVSQALLDDAEVLGDGVSTRTLELVLYDAFGSPITTGGATITLGHAAGSAELTTLQAVEDHGDGTYTLELLAGEGLGTDRLAVRIDDGVLAATVFPFPELVHREALLAAADSLSGSQGGVVELDLLGPTLMAGRTYALAVSVSGTQPGLLTDTGLTIPLNPDRLFALSPTLVAAGILAGPGVLDGEARALAALRTAPGLVAPLTGLTLWAAWFTVRPADFASNPVDIEIRP